jgi:prepilin peptidase CpaA
MLIETIRLTFFPVLLAFAAFSDLFTMTIANRVSLALVAGFFLLAVLAGMSGHDMLVHTGVGAAVLVVAFACFTQGWIGGGDAKLAAATVLWLGVGHLADYLVYASLLGGALTIGLIQFRALPMPQILFGQPWAERLHRQDTGVPYGIALAIAALVVYPQTEWMTALGV